MWNWREFLLRCSNYCTSSSSLRAFRCYRITFKWKIVLMLLSSVPFFIKGLIQHISDIVIQSKREHADMLAVFIMQTLNIALHNTEIVSPWRKQNRTRSAWTEIIAGSTDQGIGLLVNIDVQAASQIKNPIGLLIIVDQIQQIHHLRLWNCFMDSKKNLALFYSIL